MQLGPSARRRMIGKKTPLEKLLANEWARPVRLVHEEKEASVTFALVVLCLTHVGLNASVPVMLHWIKEQHGGAYPFSGAALTFHAYAAALGMGLVWVVGQGWTGIRHAMRLDMVLHFGVVAVLFSGGDTLSVYSLQYLDPGTYSLVGKSLAMVFAAGLSRAVLGRRQTEGQYALLGGIFFATFAFCRFEAAAQRHAEAAAAIVGGEAGKLWLSGLMLRILGVLMQSLAAILQEWLLRQQADVPFMLQQTWMGCGAFATTLAAWRGMDGKPLARLADGFDDWRSLVVLLVYILNGLVVGLIVKRLGALAKALCVPIHLGVCYVYAVCADTSTFKVEALGSWVVCTLLVLAFAVSKANGVRHPAR